MILRLLLAAALLLAPLAARAEGAGIALADDARLHLSFESELRFDSLAGQGGIGTATNTAFDPADFILHLRPGASVLAAGSEFTLGASGFIDYVDYTGWLAPTHELSYLGAGLQGALDAGKSGPFNFHLTEAFSRSDRSTNPALGIGTITDANDLRARLGFKPGGGALEGGLSYGLGVESYELNASGNIGCTDPTCNGSNYGSFDSVTHQFGLDARWRFFPKTAFIFDTQLSVRTYSNAGVNIPTNPLVIEGGLAGLITEKVRAVIKGGYTNTFASSGPNSSGPVAQLEMGWDPAPTASLTLGGLRTVQSEASTYAFYNDLRAYLTGRLALGGRVNVTGSASLDVINYGNSDRQDTQGQLNGAVDVELMQLIHTALGVVLTNRDSSLGSVFTYHRAEIYLKANFTY